MAFADEVGQTLKALSAFPAAELIERVGAEGDPVLESGRTFQETIDLAEELIDTTHTLLREGKIEALPAPMGKQIRAALQSISTHSKTLASGTSQPQEFENQVETFHSRLWSPGLLHTLADLPGKDAKNKSLESLKRKGRRIVRELEAGTHFVSQLQAAVAELKTQAAEAAEYIADIEHNRTSVIESANNAATHAAQAETTQERTSKVQQEIARLRTEAKSHNDEVGALKEKVKLFFQEIDSNQTKLADLFSKAETGLEQNGKSTDTLVDRLTKLEEQIDLQLQKATGASLFHAFHARRKSISIAKWVWAALSVGSLAFSVWWGIFLAGEAQTLDAIFWVKLGATLPLLAVVVFCLTQYGRERRAEEQYAFKSALSLSLVPYKELIEGVGAEDLSPEYAKFLVETVAKIYSPPLGALEAKHESGDFVSLKGIKAVTDLVEKAVNR